MTSIRIIKTPPGFAPEHIREQWVGVTIPMPSEEELAKNPVSEMRIGTDNLDGHVVSREMAIEALFKAGKQEAAFFWDDIPLAGMYLQFKKEVCEVID